MPAKSLSKRAATSSRTLVKTKILITDDHAVVRHGLKLVLGEVFAGAEFGEAGSAQELLKLLGKEHWDLIILDISMPGRNGLDALKEIKVQYPALPVLMLSMHPEQEFAVRALTAGAAGYVAKTSPPDEFVSAVNKVLAGGKYVSSSLAEQLASILEGHAKIPLHQNLSDREHGVMLMIAQGKTITEIASELSLSVKTIGTYHEHILRKMKLHNNAQIMRYAFQNRLVD